MSKNFELLTHVEGDRELFQGAKRKAQLAPTEGVRTSSVPPLLGDVARDEVARLAQRIFLLSREGKGPRAVAFCGVEHGDGATWICAHAARAVAAHGSGTVCAVDLNLRSPALHSYLGATNHCGLADSLRQEGPIRKFLEPGPDSNLWVLASGSDGDPMLLLNSERFRERMVELRAEFDYLILDVPPASHSSDSAVLGELIDGVVLVVGAHSTRRETARKAKENLQKGHVLLLGSVLNRRTFPIPEALYRRL
jgi:Mrp family chromosome partitioning ATPase